MANGRLGGDLGLTFDTSMKHHFLNSDHELGLKNTLNLAVMKPGAEDSEGKAGKTKMMDFKGLDTELRYTHGDKHCGAFFKFSSFTGGNAF